MKPQKYSSNDTNKIDLETKIIYKYPTPTKDFDIAYMVVKGRHPEDKNTFIVESACQFFMYIVKGEGTVYAGNETFQVKEKDVVFIPTNTKFAVEGNFEYVTVDKPLFTRNNQKK